jgi:hypothetical protein
MARRKRNHGRRRSLVVAAARMLDVELLVSIPASLAIALFPFWLSVVGIRIAGTGTL